MKVFQDLNLYLSASSTEDFFNDVERYLREGWTRDREAEERLEREIKGKYYYFSCKKDALIEAATIAFTRKNDKILYVANIIPRELGELSIDQYNIILSSFYEMILRPVCEKNSVNVELTSDTQSMADWISSDACQKIKIFSSAANKSTGSAHPCDEKRWFAFIVAIVENGDELDPSRLERWLIEDEGWQDRIASNLAIEYEQGVSLLKYYKQR